jgi:hypothetical protein
MVHQERALSLRSPCRMVISGKSLEIISVVRLWPAKNGVSAEAEKSSLLETVTGETTSENTVGWKIHSMCSIDLQIVDISDGAIIKCSRVSCVKVVNKSSHESKPSV